MKRLKQKIKFLLDAIICQTIIKTLWLEYVVNNLYTKGKVKQIAFLSEEFEHIDLMPFGGYGMTLKFVTDFINNNGGPLHADVLMCERKDIRSVTTKRYHSADLVFLPNRCTLDTYYQASRILKQKKINAFVGVDHYMSYEFYLKNFPYVPWVIWIKAPRSQEIWRKISAVDLESKAMGVQNLDELIRKTEMDAQSLRKMIKMSQKHGRRIYFASESSSLSDIARNQYHLQDIKPFHLPKPIPMPKQGKANFSLRPSFLFLGRLDPIKRPWIFFELAKRFKDVDFYVGGSTHHEEIMNPIIARYKDVQNLKLLGRVQGKEKEQLLNQVWAVVNTSVHEGVPVSLLEGYAYGKPAVASLDADQLTSRFGVYVGEIKGNGDDQASIDSFAHGIERILSGDINKEEIGEQARQYIKDFHSFDYFEKTLARVLNTRSEYEYISKSIFLN